MKIIYKDQVCTDKIDIIPEEIYQCLLGEVPGTSLPDGESIAEIFEQIKKDGYEKVLAITISSGLNRTCNAVRLTAEQQKGSEAYVLDAKNIGTDTGLPAIRAAKWLEEDVEWNQPISDLNGLAGRTKAFFNVATLEYLQEGGWVGLVVSTLGAALEFSPIISCDNERIYYTVGKARGHKRNLDKTAVYAREKTDNAKIFNLAVAHGDAKEETTEMEARLKEESPQANQTYFGQISPALVVHTDPRLSGVGVQVLEGQIKKGKQ